METVQTFALLFQISQRRYDFSAPRTHQIANLAISQFCRLALSAITYHWMQFWSSFWSTQDTLKKPQNNIKQPQLQLPTKKNVLQLFSKELVTPTKQCFFQSTEFDTSNSHFTSIIISKRKIPRCHSMLRSQALMAAPEKLGSFEIPRNFTPFKTSIWKTFYMSRRHRDYVYVASYIIAVVNTCDDYLAYYCVPH